MKSLLKNIFIAMIIIIVVILNIKTYIYKKENQKLFEMDDVQRPSKQELYELFDKITQKRPSYKDDWFINKGGVFGVISIRKNMMI